MKRTELKQIVKQCVADILNEQSIAKEGASNVDPTKEEMVSFLEKTCGADLVDDIFDIEAAIYWFASDYHGGQSSNLYSVLSTSEFSPGSSSRGVESEGEFATTLYKCLVDEYFPEDKSPVGVPDEKIGGLDESTNVKHVVKKPVKNTETNEWVVKWYVDGKYDEDKTYYTDDKSDAEDTYKDMVDRANKMNAGIQESGIPKVKVWLVKTKDPKSNAIHRHEILAPTKRLAILNYRHDVGYDEIISVGLLRSANSDSVNESAPPGFPKPLYHKLKKKYKGSPEKAYATMWKIHNKYGDKLEETYNALDNKCVIIQK